MDLLEERLGGFNFLNVGFEAIILVKLLNFYVEAPCLVDRMEMFNVK